MPEMTINIEDDPESTDAPAVAPGSGAASGPADGLTAQVMTAADKPPHDMSVNVGSEDSIVPVVLFVAIALTYCAKYFFAHRTRQDTQATVRMALERGEALTPDLLDRLGPPPPPKRNDLRRGVVGVCLGIGIGAFGLVLGEPEAVRPMLAVGLVPLLLGLAYLVLWRLSGDKG